MFRKSTVALALLLLSLSFRLYALGLGEIEMQSALNQPMSADIGLISTTGMDFSGVRIAIAPRAAHERLGLSYASILGNFSFAITEDSRGKPVIHISSTELVREPYLEFLLKIVWENGQMVREYTVLVDPPVTMQATPVARTPRSAPAATEPVKQTVPALVQKPVPPTYVTVPVEQKAAERYGPVRRDEALWGVAEHLRPSGSVSIQQVMIALQRANPDAFADGNINNLKAGATLKVPDREAILAINRRQARAEAERQYREWRDSRNTARDAAGKAAASLPVQEDVAVAETQARLTLTPPETEAVAGSASGSEAGSPGPEASEEGGARQQLALASEEIEAGRAQSEELQSRVLELEAQVKKMQRLLELKSEELAGLQNHAGDLAAEPAASDEAAAAGDQQADAAPADDKTDSTEKDTTITESRGIADSLMDNPVLAGLGVLVAMLLGGFFWGSMRKHSSQGMFDDEVMLDKPLADTRGDAASTVSSVNISDPGRFNRRSSEDVESAASGGVNDPETEADVYLAYGRIQQAEDVLQAALQDDPGNMALRAKLLRVYHAAGNVAAFNSAASEFRELVTDDDGLWGRIAVMGNELSPDNELYQTAGMGTAERGDAAEFDADLADLDDASPRATVDAVIQDMNAEAEADVTDTLPESLEFTLDDEDDEAEGLLASADEVATKLDLARAYLDMEDPEGARSILQEVIEEGDEEQKSEAQSLISKIA